MPNIINPGVTLTQLQENAGNVRGPVTKTVTFTGASALGATGTDTLWFTITGTIEIISLTALCTTTLVGATGTLTLGITGVTNHFIVATAAPDLVTNDFWFDATPTEVAAFAIPAAFKNIMIQNAANILSAVAGATGITAGVLRLDAFWRPISSDGNLVAA